MQDLQGMDIAGLQSARRGDYRVVYATVTVFATRARDFIRGTYGLPRALTIKKLDPSG